MMNTRLKQFMAAENITQAQLADRLNVVRASVSHILSGRNNPSYEFIKALLVNYPRLNIEWLMFGKGKMYKDQDSAPIGQSQPPKETNGASLFPADSAEESVNSLPYSLSDDITDGKNAATELVTDNVSLSQKIVNQRKVVKVTILFDDGTYQEL